MHHKQNDGLKAIKHKYTTEQTNMEQCTANRILTEHGLGAWQTKAKKIKAKYP
jgi:hypothetical protein